MDNQPLAVLPIKIKPSFDYKASEQYQVFGQPGSKGAGRSEKTHKFTYLRNLKLMNAGIITSMSSQMLESSLNGIL